MRFGHFDDETREYVITRPDTPLPWINYLGCEEYFAIISNTAGGYSFHRDARLRRLTRYRYNNIPLDSNGRYLYLRDRDSGAFWSPTWQPTRTPLKDGANSTLAYQVADNSPEVHIILTSMEPVRTRTAVLQTISDLRIVNRSPDIMLANSGKIVSNFAPVVPKGGDRLVAKKLEERSETKGKGDSGAGGDAPPPTETRAKAQQTAPAQTEAKDAPRQQDHVQTKLADDSITFSQQSGIVSKSASGAAGAKHGAEAEDAKQQAPATSPNSAAEQTQNLPATYQRTAVQDKLGQTAQSGETTLVINMTVKELAAFLDRLNAARETPAGASAGREYNDANKRIAGDEAKPATQELAKETKAGELDKLQTQTTQTGPVQTEPLVRVVITIQTPTAAVKPATPSAK